MNGKSTHERLLVILLRFSGCVTLLAFPIVLLPESWMAAVHRWLGLGSFPATPLVDYLTRSLSILYGFHGGLLLLVSVDVRRYSSIVTYFACMYVLLGLFLFAIDVHAGLPAFWTLGEGPPIAAFGFLLLYLCCFVQRS